MLKRYKRVTPVYIYFSTTLISLRYSLLKLLLKNGADPHLQNNWGEDCLYICAGINDDFAVIKFLIETGLNPNQPCRRQETPLHRVCSKRNLDNNSSNLKIIELLIQKGANINSQNIYGWTPLDMASWFDANQWDFNDKAIQFLLKNGAKVSKMHDKHASSVLTDLSSLKVNI